MLNIYNADIADLEELSVMFDLYRQFYNQSSNIAEAKRFLRERIINNESVIFVSSGPDKKLTGFVQLYPIFSSVGMRRSWLLNDLFVKDEFRNKGIARKLLDKCKVLAQETNASGLFLETSKENKQGNYLYPAEGFMPEDKSNFYFWKNPMK